MFTFWLIGFFWLIGLILNLIVVYLWRNSYFYEGGKYQRIPLNMIVVIIFGVIANIPLLNIAMAITILISFCCAYTDDLEFRGPKWLSKTFK